MWIAQSRKLVNRISVAHGQVAFNANRSQVGNLKTTTLALRDIVTHLVGKRCNDVFAPRHVALGLELVAIISDPTSFANCTGDVGFCLGWFGSFAHF